ncbi:MAG: hypothetical protein WAN48_14070 [Actinomycetes bacterium]
MKDSDSTSGESTPVPRVRPPGPFVDLPERVDVADMVESVQHTPQPQQPYEENADLWYLG